MTVEIYEEIDIRTQVSDNNRPVTGYNNYTHIVPVSDVHKSLRDNFIK